MKPKKKILFAFGLFASCVLASCGPASSSSLSSDKASGTSVTQQGSENATATAAEIVDKSGSTDDSFEASKGSDEASKGTIDASEESVDPIISSEEINTSEEKPVGSIGDANWINYAETFQCQLTLDYEGHSFWTDGIEKVTLHATIDGDTAHFMTSTGDILKSRFYGIDTPESTGAVQPYGKQASKYTSGVLEEAGQNGTIVVSSAQLDYGKPNADSTGSRYVSLIWVNPTVKNAPYDQLMLLNLMVVEYGYSWVKSVNSMPDYAPIFYAAESQAKAYMLKLHSGEKDPYFNYGDYKDVSLLDIKEEVVAYLRDNTHKIAYDNEKVRVQGTVAGFANHIIYIEDFCFYYRKEYNDEGELISQTPIFKSTGEENTDLVVIPGETGEYAGLNIFAGMSSIPSKFTRVGNFIQVCGLALDSQFGFQVTDGKFKSVAYDDNDAKLLLKAEDNTDEHALKTFQYTSAELSAICRANNYESLNCRVEVTDATTVTSSFDSDSGATYLYSNEAWSVYFTFIYKPYPDDSSVSWTSGEKFHNHQFRFSGVLAIHTTQAGKNLLYMYPGKNSDIVWVDTDRPVE